MSMMIMFGDETFEGFSAKEQHIKQKRVKVSGRITRIAEQQSCELLRGSGLFAFVRVLGVALTHTQWTRLFIVVLKVIRFLHSF